MTITGRHVIKNFLTLDRKQKANQHYETHNEIKNTGRIKKRKCS